MAAYEIVERDEAGRVTGSYVGDASGGRVDVIVRICLICSLDHGFGAACESCCGP
jgi:hypothetical protein